MDFAIPSDVVVRTALVTGVVLLGLTLLILVNVLLLGLYNRRQALQDERFRGVWQPIMAAASIGEFPEQLPDLHWADRLRFLLLWNRLQNGVRGTARDHLNSLLRRTGMDRIARLYLEAGSTRSRLVAITTFRHLRPEDTAERLLRLAREAPAPVAITAARTLAGIDGQGQAAALIAIMLKRRDWSSTHCVDILGAAPPEQVATDLLSAFGQATPEERERLLPLLACVWPLQRAPALRAFLDEHPDDGLTAAAVDLLTVARDPADTERMRQLVTHPQAHVRTIAAWALAKLGGGDADFERLWACLSDPSWHVRQSAAAALVELPGLERARLETLPDDLDDAYGRHALERALEASA